MSIPLSRSSAELLDYATLLAQQMIEPESPPLVEPSHLFLAMLAQPDDDLRRVLVGASYPISQRFETLRGCVEMRPSPPQELQRAPTLKLALNSADEHAIQLGATEIAPIHLLLGLLTLEDSKIKRELLAYGVTAETLRTRLATSILR